MTRFALGRRTFIALGAASAAAPFLPKNLLAQVPKNTPLHGLAAFGELKYKPDFPHLDYVDVDAPKGGRIVTQSPSRSYNQNFNTFDTLNSYVLRGNGAFGMGLTFATLMTSTLDEIGGVYAYAAESIAVSEDRRELRFVLDAEAKFHDGTPITAADVVWSMETLREFGHENLAIYLRQIETLEAVDERTVLVRIPADAGNATILTIAAGCPIFSPDWWDGRRFDANLSDAPLGSGPYRVGRFSFGTYIDFERVEDFWAADRPIFKGRYNFDRIRYEYYRRPQRRLRSVQGRSHPRA